MGELAGATGAAPKYKFTPSGALRPMKMGTTASPRRYEGAGAFAPWRRRATPDRQVRIQAARSKPVTDTDCPGSSSPSSSD